jgi:ATP-dependent DNA helicase RecG
MMNFELKNNSALSTQHSALFCSWGRGIEKITDACKAAGLPEPIIEENSGGVAVELLKVNPETRVKTPEAILQALKEDDSLTLAEVAERAGKSVSAVERAAKKLSDQGKLKYIGPQKGGHWEVIESDEI